MSCWLVAAAEVLGVVAPVLRQQQPRGGVGLAEDQRLLPLPQEPLGRGLGEVCLPPGAVGLRGLRLLRHAPGEVLHHDLLADAVWRRGERLPGVHEALPGQAGGVEVLQDLAAEVEALASLPHGPPVLGHLLAGRERGLQQLLAEVVHETVKLLLLQATQALRHHLRQHVLDGRLHLIRPELGALHDGAEELHVGHHSRACVHDVAELPGSAQLVVGEIVKDGTEKAQDHAALDRGCAPHQGHHRRVVRVVRPWVLCADLDGPGRQDHRRHALHFAPGRGVGGGLGEVALEAAPDLLHRLPGHALIQIAHGKRGQLQRP
mmetsp:Transcript_170212/g.413781  ORF Transcript_170212/g.413781 Transcript_170212/m.413781 type:complete len:319 (+) Transcript_170212:1-957(+)